MSCSSHRKSKGAQSAAAALAHCPFAHQISMASVLLLLLLLLLPLVM